MHSQKRVSGNQPIYIIFGDRNPPYLALGSNIPSARRPGQRFHLQGVFTESLLCKQAWRNPKEGRVGCLHQNIFTRKLKWLILHLTLTFAIMIHIPRPLRPCILRPCVPVPHVPASHTWCPQVPRLASPSPKSPHTRPDVPVPLSPSHFFTQPFFLPLEWTLLCLCRPPPMKHIQRDPQIRFAFRALWSVLFHPVH